MTQDQQEAECSDMEGETMFIAAGIYALWVVSLIILGLTYKKKCLDDYSRLRYWKVMGILSGIALFFIMIIPVVFAIIISNSTPFGKLLLAYAIFIVFTGILPVNLILFGNSLSYINNATGFKKIRPVLVLIIASFALLTLAFYDTYMLYSRHTVQLSSEQMPHDYAFAVEYDSNIGATASGAYGSFSGKCEDSEPMINNFELHRRDYNKTLTDIADVNGTVACDISELSIPQTFTLPKNAQDGEYHHTESRKFQFGDDFDMISGGASGKFRSDYTITVSDNAITAISGKHRFDRWPLWVEVHTEADYLESK